MSPDTGSPARPIDLSATETGNRLIFAVWLTLLAIVLRVALQVYVDYSAEFLRAAILWENAVEHVAFATRRAWILVVALAVLAPHRRPWSILRFLVCTGLSLVILSGFPQGEIEYLPSWDSRRGRLGWACIGLSSLFVAVLDRWIHSRHRARLRLTLAGRFLATALLLIIGGGVVVAAAEVLKVRRHTVTVERSIADLIREWQEGRASSTGPAAAGAVRVGSLVQRGQDGKTTAATPALIVPPGEGVEFTVDPRGNCDLLFACGLELADSSAGKGRMKFTAEINGKTAYHVILSGSPQDCWREAEVPLSTFSGQTIRVALKTEAVDPFTGKLKAGFARPLVLRSERAVRRPLEADLYNVLLIVVNCLRADHLGCYGYGRNTSATIDSLARESILFEQAISPAPWTPPALASLLTGTYPHGHRVLDCQRLYLSDSIRTLPEVLREHGISTGGWTTHAMISRRRGFHQGFEVWREFEWKPGGLVTREFKEWVQRYSGYQFFAMLHYADPHHPYYPQNAGIRRGFLAEGADSSVNIGMVRKARERAVGTQNPFPEAKDLRTLIDLYDAEISSVDHELGKVFGQLRSMGLWEKTIVVLTADHGEQFLDHGDLYHAWSLHEELLRVPLIVRDPRMSGGGRISEVVSLTQIPATVMQFFDLLPQGLGGLSVLALPPWGAAPSFVHAHTSQAILEGQESRELFMARNEGHKLVTDRAGNDWLFDLIKDPRESTSMSAERVDEVGAFSRKIEAWLEGYAAGTFDLRLDTLDDKTRSLIQFLGYSLP